jgi:hypothetical protein
VLTGAGTRRDGDRDRDPAATERRVYEALHDGGVDATTAGKLVALLHPLEGYGQLGVTRPAGDGKDVRVGDELSWIDTSLGRYRIASTTGPGDGADRDGWVSINPLHPDELFSVLRGFVSNARR